MVVQPHNGLLSNKWEKLPIHATTWINLKTYAEQKEQDTKEVILYDSIF